MAKKTQKKTQKKTKTRRADPDVIAKRRAARTLNKLFASAGQVEHVDQRSEKRRQRLITKLRDGNKGEPLKALDALQCADELLTGGMSYTELRKLKPKVPKMRTGNIEMQEAVVTMQRLYGFHTQAWRLLGVDIDAEMPEE